MFVSRTVPHPSYKPIEWERENGKQVPHVAACEQED